LTIKQPSLEVIEKPKEMVDFHVLIRSTVQTENQQNEGIFTCSNDGCMSSFNTHQELHIEWTYLKNNKNIFTSEWKLLGTSITDINVDLWQSITNETRGSPGDIFCSIEKIALSVKC
jgi:hypothetical protein